MSDPQAVARVCVFSRIAEPGLGDLVQRNIFLAVLRRAYPAASITWFVGDAITRSSYMEELVRHHSLADEVVVVPSPRSGRTWRAFTKDLAQHRFDVCVVDPASVGLGVREAMDAGIAVRLAVQAPPEWGPGWLCAVRGFLGLRAAPEVLELPNDPDVLDYVKALSDAVGVPVPEAPDLVPRVPFTPAAVPDLTGTGPLVGIAAGGERAWNRRWPLANYIELGARLAGGGATIVAIGSRDELPLAERFVADVLRRVPDAAVHALTGVPLAATLTVLDRMDLLVGNDSGPAHLAAALATPTVVVYGPTDDGEWARIYPHHSPVRASECLSRWDGAHIACDTCVRAVGSLAGPYPVCLTGVSVDEVWSRVAPALSL